MEVGYREAVLPDLCPQSKEKPRLVGGRGGQSTHDFRKGEALGLSCLLLCSPGMSCPFSSSEAGVTLHIKWQARRWAAREVPEPGMGNWHCPAPLLRRLEQSPPVLCFCVMAPQGQPSGRGLAPSGHPRRPLFKQQGWMSSPTPHPH